MPKKKRMSQKERVLQYLRTHKKPLTPLDAWQKCGVYRISDVIYKLRKQGYIITTDDVIIKNHYGEKCKVAGYQLWEE